MTRFVIRRGLWTVALLLAISLTTFLIFYVMPSVDPAVLRAGRQPDPKLVEDIRTNLGLDRSPAYQYLHYLNRLVFHFDFGHSYFRDQDVRKELLARFPATLMLAVGAAVLWLCIGVGLGVVSAIRRGSLADRAAMSFGLIGISAPEYWLGLVFLYLFSRDGTVLRIFPGAGTCYDFHPFRCAPSFLLPWIVLAIGFGAFYARFVRSSMMDTLHQDYVRTARAKGASERRVVFHHALRGALTPVVSIFSLDLAFLLGGAVLIESVFNLPGLGRYAVAAIGDGDLPVIQGTVLFGAFFVVVANAVVDVAYAFLDPRVRHV